MRLVDKMRTCLKRQSFDDSTTAEATNDKLKSDDDDTMLKSSDDKKNGIAKGVPNGAEAGGLEVSDQTDAGGQEVRRGIQWTSPTEFLLTCLGYTVGLGNVWRFPYLCYKNGGGAFLIPYAIMILCIGIPLLFMEYVCGQYFGIGSLSIYKTVCPLFKGIGICYCVLNTLVSIYYNVIIALSIYYIFSSFTSVLPWSHCNNTYNTLLCGDPSGSRSLLNGTGMFNTSTMSTNTLGPLFAATDSVNASASVIERASPSEEFFRLGLMGEEDDQMIDNIGAVRWKLCLCLLLAWILVAIFVSKGIKSSGKVSYLTATFPYVMLTVLVVKGVTLDGALDGILYFIVPQWDKLLDADVWFKAAVQMFYALNLAWGGMITMSSYNQFNHNCYRDAIVINLVSFGTSLYAGIAVFAIIGHMAHEQDLPIDEVIKSGPGLAFVAYPRALSLMPAPQFFSVAFFFMLFLLGIGSQMVSVETIMTGIVDSWHVLVKKWQYRVATISVVCTVMFLLGIPCTTQGGMYVIQLMDHYSAGFSLLIIMIFECIIFNWIYGHDKLKQHVRKMLNYRLGVHWTFCWKFFSPALIVVVAVFSFIKYKPVEYAGKSYPGWAEFLGWCMALASILPIIVVALYVFIRANGDTPLQKLKKATTCKIVDQETIGDRLDGVLPLYSITKDIIVDGDAQLSEEKISMMADKNDNVSFTPKTRKANNGSRTNGTVSDNAVIR